MRNFYKFTCLLFFTLCAKAQVPTPTINGPITSLCTDKPLSFSAHGADPSAELHWNIKPAASVVWPADSTDTTITFTLSNTGTYTLTLRTLTGVVSSTVSKTFNVYRSAKASFNASLSGQGFPAELMLTNYSTNSVKNYWIFDGNTGQKDSAATLVKDYTASGNYSVALIALGTNGCNDEAVYTFHIADSSGITLPNVFSPNGDDINEVFRPITRGLSTLNAWVYNRFGTLIASWDRINGFWDGFTTSGEPCSAGIYFVVVEAQGFDGKNYKLKGNITLLR